MPSLHFQNNLLLEVVVCHSHELPVFPFSQKNALNCHLNCLILPAGSLLKISVTSVTVMSLEPNKQVMPPPWKKEMYFYNSVIKSHKCTISLLYN